MSLKDVQKEVDNWVTNMGVGYWTPHEILARLTEETGELAREINHNFGPKKKKDTERSKEIADEIGDLIFTLTCLANSLKIDMDESFSKVIYKYNDRDKERWNKENGT